MHTVKLFFTVIMALVLMGCPPPVSDNPNAPASEVNDSAQSSDNPNDSASGGNAPPPVPKHHVAYVSSGRNHSMILKTDDTLWAVGNNQYGQLGNGNSGSNVKVANMVQVKIAKVASVSVGYEYTMIVKKDGTLWTFGQNEYGQLGDGSSTNRPTLVQAKIADVDQVSSGSTHTMILKNNDMLWGVGNNFFGQLGDGTGTTGVIKKNPVQVKIGSGQPMIEIDQVSAGGGHTMILKRDETLWAVGLNHKGQLGDGTTTGKKWPVQVMELPEGGSTRPMTNVKQVSSGGAYTMILKRDDTLWAVGLNNDGQLGDGKTADKLNPEQVMIEVAQVSAGISHTMVLLKNGELWAFGKNNKGQLGNGSTANSLDPVQVMEIPAGDGVPQPMTDVAQISAGNEHTMIVKTNGTLWGTGYNGYGQLGDGKTADKLNPEQITPVAGCHNVQ